MRSAQDALSRSGAGPAVGPGRRKLDLLALLSILVVSAGVYAVAGAAAFGTVTGATATFHAAWRARR